MDNSTKRWWRRPWVWVVAVPAAIVAIATAVYGPAPQDTTAAASTPVVTQIPVAATTFAALTTTIVGPSTTVAPPPATAGQPVATPQPKPTPAIALCGAPQNPMGYNYCADGALIIDPDLDTCAYFDCIKSWSDGKGYMEQCRDDTVSMSGGRSGSCADHGGDKAPVYK